MELEKFLVNAWQMTALRETIKDVLPALFQTYTRVLQTTKKNFEKLLG